jgi:hypothetical protein
MTKEQKVFTMWKDNRTDQEYTITPDELKVKFAEWMKTKEKGYLEYYHSQLVKIFLGANDGMSSVFNYEDLEEMMKVLMDTKWDYLNSIGIK